MECDYCHKDSPEGLFDFYGKKACAACLKRHQKYKPINVTDSIKLNAHTDTPMSDAELLLLVESRKKSGLIAALLNIFLPGAGYIYCGRWILGIFVFIAVIVFAIVSFGVSLVPIYLILIIDGFLCAQRYNKRMVERMIKQRTF